MKPISSDSNNSYKVITLGEAGAGKTSLLLRYTRNVFDPNISTTIGANFFTVPVEYNQQLGIELELWDTAGQERYRSVLPLYSHNSSAILLVFDVSGDDPAGSISYWYDYLINSIKLPNVSENTDNTVPESNQNKFIPVYLVGNKYDLIDDKYNISDFQHQIEEIAKKYGMKLFFTSAKTGQNINALFKTLINDIVRLENRGMAIEKRMTLDSTKTENAKCCGG